MERDAEPPAQRRGDQPGARRRADKREFRQVDFDRPRRRPLPDDDVELIIFHRRVEHLFNRRVQPVNFVDKQHVAFLQVGKQCRQIAGLFNDGTGRRFNIAAHLVGDDVGERGLADAGRAVQQNMVQRLAAFSRRLNEDVEVTFGLALADIFAQPPRPQAQFELLFVVARGGGRDDAVFCHQDKLRLKMSRFLFFSLPQIVAAP